MCVSAQSSTSCVVLYGSTPIERKLQDYFERNVTVYFIMTKI